MRISSFSRILPVLGAAAMIGCGYSFTQSLKPDTGNLSEIKTVAVAPFGNLSTSDEAGDVVSEMLTQAVLGKGKYKVIRSAHLAMNLKEVFKQERLILDREQAVRIGRAFKADAVLYGTVTEYWYLEERKYQPAPEREPAIGVNARLVDVRSGVVIGVASVSRTGGVMVHPFTKDEKKMEKIARRVSREVVDELFTGKVRVPKGKPPAAGEKK